MFPHSSAHPRHAHPSRPTLPCALQVLKPAGLLDNDFPLTSLDEAVAILAEGSAAAPPTAAP